MKESHNVLLTFDYEMFLGQSGTIDRCLVSSTNQLLKTLARYDMHVTFFVDATFLSFLKKQENVSQLSKIEDNILSILNNGHRVELHIHPQWIDAVVQNGGSAFRFKNYRYYSLRDCPNEVGVSLFDDAITLLSSICQRHDSRYEIKGYRAGGWCVDAFAVVEPFFKRYNLLFDSSVLPGLKKDGNIQSYDYTDISLDIPVYRFNMDVHCCEENGLYYEVPISIYEARPYVKYSRILSRNLNKKKTITFGDGLSIDQNNSDLKKDFLFYWRKLFLHQKEMCTIDGYCNTSNLVNIIRNRAVTTVIGHPKSLTLKSLETIEDLGKQDACFITIYDYLKK